MSLISFRNLIGCEFIEKEVRISTEFMRFLLKKT